MHKALLKDSFIEIKKSYKRFLSILLMAMLGVGFFVGIKATAPNMKYRLDDYFDNMVVFDLKVMSTLGLTDDDIEYIRKLDGVKNAYGVYDKDVILENNNTEYVLNAIEYNANINQVELLKGNLPQNENECVVEEKLISDLNMNIGDTIYIKEVIEENETEIFNNTELKIVGIVKSPLYISVDRGSSKLGSGKIDYYIYISENNINSDIYTSIYITIKGAQELRIDTNKYKVLINNAQDQLKEIASIREQIRYDNLINEMEAKVNEAEDELNSEKEKAELEITKAEKDLQTTENEIIKGEAELNKNIVNADKKFADAEKTLQEKEQEYNRGKIEAENGIAQLEEQKNTMNIQLEQVNTGIEEIKAIYDTSDPDTKIFLDEQLEDLINKKNQIENGIKEIEETIYRTNNELENSKLQLENTKKELEENKLDTYAKLNTAKSEIANSKLKLEGGKRELEENKQEFLDKIQEAETKISDAKEKINTLEKPKWYVLNRNEVNSGYRSLMQDSESINNISKVFPLMFFIVATLMSLTSMTRMIDEQRTGIGTLKALGYNKIQISSKYILYSILATLLGSIIGTLLGYKIIPPIIITAYLTLYNLPSAPIVYDFDLIVSGLLVALTCIVGGAFYASYRKLKYVPAKLMRPKAPKTGKRVFIERITIIWKRLTFSQKVTLRNIFRYKKRFLMTIIGIGGATALIVVGFGIKNSVSRIASTQYQEIYRYQMTLGLKNSITEEERNNIVKNIENEEQIDNVLYSNIQNIKITKNNETKDIQLMVINDKDNIHNFITLRNSKSKEKYELKDNGIIITERISKILGIKKGDTILIRNEDDVEKEVLVYGITEHYITHYIYMTDNFYKELFGESLNPNVILIKTEETEKSSEQELGKTLLKNDGVSSVNMFSESTPQLDKTMETLDLVVVVLIISAGLLTFVVLYSLSNVNIGERIRELATLKVLGFYDNEVDQYVSREMIILSVIGILLGLVTGNYLTSFVLQTVEQELVMYPLVIEPISYIYSVVIVIIFTFIVNIFSHYALKKINMIESLKSVE